MTLIGYDTCMICKHTWAVRDTLSSVKFDIINGNVSLYSSAPDTFEDHLKHMRVRKVLV